MDEIEMTNDKVTEDKKNNFNQLSDNTKINESNVENTKEKWDIPKDEKTSEASTDTPNESMPSTSASLADVSANSLNEEKTTCTIPNAASNNASSPTLSPVVGFPKLKKNIRNRHFRRKKIRNDSSNSGTSSDEEEAQPTDQVDRNNISPVNHPEREVDNNPVQNNRFQISSGSDDTSNSLFNDTDSTYSTLDSVESENINELYKKICNTTVKYNWFVLPEVLKRQMGFSAKLNGHLLFQQRYYGSLHAVQRLELMEMMEYHDGCVNSLGFNPSGSLLASGSDDLRVVIWDWANGKRKTSFVTRHRSNVFQSKFLTLSGESELQLVTSARDGQVWMWQFSSEGLRGSRKLGEHKGPSHKLTLLKDQPHIILSCGEDGVVFSHDVRDNRATKLVSVTDNEKRKIPLYSIHSHPLNSYEFVVSGHDQAALVYDQRKLCNEHTPLKKFYVEDDKMPDRHITASVYNYTGTEIVVSYNDDDIYLFDTTVPGTKYVHCYQGHRNGATIKGVNFFGPQSEYVISGSDCGNIYFWDKSTQVIVQWLLADKGVVNCLEPHPSMPILASSGLDSDVKIWVPSKEEPNQMEGLKNTITSNRRIRNMERSSGNHAGDRVMWMLWRAIQEANQHAQPIIDSDDDDGEHPVNPELTPPSSDSDSTDTDNADHDGNVACFPS